jgi:hypothetical protein
MKFGRYNKEQEVPTTRGITEEIKKTAVVN